MATVISNNWGVMTADYLHIGTAMSGQCYSDLLWRCRNPARMSSRANFDVEFLCNKITLPYTSTKLPCKLCVRMGVNCYYNHHVSGPGFPAIISFFFKNEKGVEGLDICWWQGARVACGGVLQGVQFSLLPLGHKCTAEAVDQAYRVTKRLCWRKYHTHLWVYHFSFQCYKLIESLL